MEPAQSRAFGSSADRDREPSPSAGGPSWRRRLLSPLGIALQYAAFGVAWILVSSWLTHALGGADEAVPVRTELVKEGVFIAITALIAYLLMRAWEGRIASAESEAERAAERYRMLFASNPHPMWVYDLQTLAFTAVNDAAVKRYGHSRDAFLPMKITDIRPPEDVPAMLEAVRRATGSEETTGEWRHLTKSGELLQVAVRSCAIDFKGRPSRLCAATDVTQRVLVEQARAQTESQLRRERDYTDAVLQAAGALVAVLDPEGRIESFNRACQRISGYSLEEARGRKPWEFLVPSEDAERVRDRILDLVPGREPNTGENQWVTRDGSRRVIQWSNTGIFSDTGELLHIIGTGVDVTERRNAETQARTTAQRLQFALEAAGMGAWQWITTTDQTIRVGGAWRGMLGDAVGATGSEFMTHVHPEDRQRVMAASVESLRTGQSFHLEYRIVQPDGSIIWVADSAMPVLDDPSQPASLFGISRDITAIKRAQEALERSERRLSELFNAVVDPIWDWDVKEDLSSFSPGWERLIEVPPGSVKAGKNTWGSRVHPDDLPVVLAQLREVLSGERPVYEAEYRVRAESGYKWVISRGRVVERNAAGEALRMVGGIADITARRNAQEALRQSEENYRRIVETATEGIWIIDTEGRTTFANARMAEMLGETLQGMAGTSMYDFADDAACAEAEKNLARRRSGISESHDFKFRRRDGSDLWAIVSTHAIIDPVHGFKGALAMVTDITSRKSEEQRRERLEREQESLLSRLQLMLDRMPVGCIVCDPAMRITYLNEAAEEIFGFSREQITGKSPLEVLTPPAARADMEEVFRRVASGDMHSHGTFENIRRSGEGISCQWLNTPLFTQEGELQGMLSMVQDITERQRGETALRKSERDYRSLFELASDAILIFDPFTEQVLDANQRACEIYLMPREQLVGSDLREISLDVRKGRERIRQTLTLGRVEGYETVQRRGDGSEMVLLVNAAAVEFRGRPAVLSINRDITERRKADRRQSLMMAELDHRVKNNLAAVLSVADQTLRTSSSLKEFGDAFTGRLRALARMHGVLARSKWVGARLRDLVSQSLEAYLVAGGQVEAEGDDVLLPARAASPVAMALHELATNAAKYGALSTPTGVVSIQWSKFRDESDRECVKLVWTERGGPPVDPPTRRGFGTELIEGGIAYELHGTVTLAFNPEGVRCEITIPLEEDEQPWVTVSPAAAERGSEDAA